MKGDKVKICPWRKVAESGLFHASRRAPDKNFKNQDRRSDTPCTLLRRVGGFSESGVSSSLKDGAVANFLKTVSSLSYRIRLPPIS